MDVGNLYSEQISLENLPPGLKKNCGDTAKGNIKGQAEYTRCINVKYGNTATDQCVMGLGSLPGRWRANDGLNVINDENEDKKEDATYEQDVMTNRFLLSGWRIKDELGINSESWDLDKHDEGEYKKRDAAYKQQMMT